MTRARHLAATRKMQARRRSGSAGRYCLEVWDGKKWTPSTEAMDLGIPPECEQVAAEPLYWMRIKV